MNIFINKIAKKEPSMPIRFVDLIRVGSFKQFRKVYGFSLMEMMVIMLVVALVLAISSPMITKKHVPDGFKEEVWSVLANGASPTAARVDIGWNTGRQALSAIIGGADIEVNKYDTGQPGLIINTKDTRPHIGFMYDSSPKGTIDMITGIAIGSKPKATAVNSIAIGAGANAAAVNSIAIGPVANTGATGTDAFAYGYKAKATKMNSTAIGYTAQATGNNSMAIGVSKAPADDSVAIGYTADTNNAKNSVALGHIANLSGSSESVAIGSGTRLSGGARTVVFGDYAGADGATNTVLAGCFAGSRSGMPWNVSDAVIMGAYGMGASNSLGLGATQVAKDGTAVGYGANVSGVSGTALGATSIAKTNALAIGYKANAASYSIAIGSNKDINDKDYSVLLGRDAAVGKNSVAIGYKSGGSSDNILAVGNNAKANGSNSVALGKEASAVSDAVAILKSTSYYGNTSGIGSVRVGHNAYASDTNSIAIGVIPKASKSGAVAISYAANASSANAVALGYSSSASGADSVAIGKSSYVSGDNSVALGTSSGIYSDDSVAIGNIPYSYKNFRKNVIVIGNENSTVYIPGKLVADGIEDELPGNVRVTGSMLVDGHLVVQAGATLGANVIGGKWNSTAANHAFVSMKLGDFKYNDTYGYHSQTMVTKNDEWRGDTEEYGVKTLTYGEIMGRYGLCSAFPDEWCFLPSDIRLKDIIGENLDAMDKINRLKVYNYTYKSDKDKVQHVGVIAQDLQKVFPNAVTTDENGFLEIRHEDIFYAMVNALKELDAKIRQIASDLAKNVKLATANALRIKAKDKEMKQLKLEVAELRVLMEEAIK